MSLLCEVQICPQICTSRRGTQRENLLHTSQFSLFKRYTELFLLLDVFPQVIQHSRDAGLAIMLPIYVVEHIAYLLLRQSFTVYVAFPKNVVAFPKKGEVHIGTMKSI